MRWKLRRARGASIDDHDAIIGYWDARSRQIVIAAERWEARNHKKDGNAHVVVDVSHNTFFAFVFFWSVPPADALPAFPKSQACRPMIP